MSTEDPRQGAADPGPAPWDPQDHRYAGAAQVVAAEREYLRARRRAQGRAAEEDPAGLALSGGGIRSATFALGALQALARRGWLARFDYLSTVSGGGYIGSSLTWFLHRMSCGLGEDDFPFGTRRRYREDARSGLLEGGAADKSRVLRWLRQHAEYLRPGGGINLASLAAVVLRGALLSVIVYFPMLVGLFLLLHAVGLVPAGVRWGPAGFSEWPGALWFAAFVLLFFALLSLAYGVSTWLSRRGDLLPVPERCWYVLRRAYEITGGRLLAIAAALVVLGSVPLAAARLDAGLALAGAEGGTAVGVVSALLGAVSGGLAYVQRWKLPRGVLVGAGAVLLVYGLLLLGYQTSAWWLESYRGAGWLLWLWPVVLVALAAAIGYFVNLNYLSIHRYYRDRLMEAFMPPPEIAESGGVDAPTGPSAAADVARLHALCDPADPRAPYHIVNTNVVLVESGIPKFHGRGGDSFVLSPRYCGSNATGWAPTRRFMEGRMTLATAMAISGAAANPHTGVGGEGITRRPALSFLMALLNIRLGYWAPNPNFGRYAWLRRIPASLRPGRWQSVVQSRIPNFLWPGLWDLIPQKKLNEQSAWLLLTDGGHFENLGLYELVRRRCRVILLCDAGADPDFAFEDLANALEKIRADLGVAVALTAETLAPLVPSGDGAGADARRAAGERFAARGHLVAAIHYPDGTQGRLLYLKTTFTAGLPADLYGYRLAHPDFPDQPTADQFFDEKQFEAYRELGYQLAEAMIGSQEVRDDALLAGLFAGTPRGGSGARRKGQSRARRRGKKPA